MQRGKGWGTVLAAAYQATADSRTCSSRCLQQALPVLLCGDLLQLGPNLQGAPHHVLLPSITQCLLLLQQRLQVSLQELIQQLVHVLARQLLTLHSLRRVYMDREGRGMGGLRMPQNAHMCAHHTMP